MRSVYRAEDDPVALAIFHFRSEVWCQVVFIDVAQKVTDWAQHHHLRTQTHAAARHRRQLPPETTWFSLLEEEEKRRIHVFYMFSYSVNSDLNLLSPASLTGSHPGWSGSPDRCSMTDWGWSSTGRWGGAPGPDADCLEMTSERRRMVLNHHQKLRRKQSVVLCSRQEERGDALVFKNV